MQKQGVGTPACLRGQTSLITPCLTYFDPRGKTMHGIPSNHLQVVPRLYQGASVEVSWWKIKYSSKSLELQIHSEKEELSLLSLPLVLPQPQKSSAGSTVVLPW